MKPLSLVVPCYNESKNLPALVRRIGEALRESGLGRGGFELVLVENGSTDDSAAVMAELQRQPEYGFLRVVAVPVNQGYGYGMLQGLRAAEGRLVATSHADLQCHPRDVFRAYEVYQATADRPLLIKGVRRGRTLGAVVVSAHERQVGSDRLDDFLRQQSDVGVAFGSAEIPGWNLSLRLLDHAAADAILLANHGVVLQGEEPKRVLERWERVERAFCREWHCTELIDFGARLARGELARRPFRAYFPDAVVFRDAIVAAASNACEAPVASPEERDALEMLEAIVLLERACPALGELDAAQCGAIATLPAEAFRRS